MLLGEMLDRATRRLTSAGVPEARHNAEILLSHVTGRDRGVLLASRRDAVDPALASRYGEAIRCREQREPLQHILGTQEFYALTFQIDARALVPRPETEGLVQAVLDHDLPNRSSVADLGSGSGCIAVALAVTRRDLEVFGLERCPEALELARINARRHALEDRIDFVEGDWRAAPPEWRERMDAVVCNPPYVREDEWIALDPEVRDHDPRDALVAGPTGLEAYESVVPACFDMLRPEGIVALELGLGQEDGVRAVAARAGFRGIEVRPDLQGIPRVLIAEKA